MKNFWEKLEKPFFVLAPLANVTDASFRQHIIRYSRPDVLWTEFVSADGLCHPVGKQALLQDLVFQENERPIVAQLFTAHPEKMREAAKIVAELGFDGIDINMGCPDKNVMKQGAGASCMKDPENAVALIQAAKDGVRDAGKDIPVSVKTRLGFNEDVLEEWLPKLLSAEPAALTLHARTKKDMSKVPARWERVKRAIEIRDELGSKTLIIGNGDVTSMAHARFRVAETGCDGVMFGRAIFGNPWLFDSARQGLTAETGGITVAEKIDAALVHTEMYLEHWQGRKSFELMKKFYRAYINNFPLAKELRAEMMEKKSFEEIKEIVEKFKREHPEVLSEISEAKYLL
ncbi:MAG: tRNA-dihydrouridine synthase [Candidatus Moranbacteria bacterium]|nr:tRNA-dihydrouridine synthase [Candidatus Moranbacteria bacterium]